MDIRNVSDMRPVSFIPPPFTHAAKLKPLTDLQLPNRKALGADRLTMSPAKANVAELAHSLTGAYISHAQMWTCVSLRHLSNVKYLLIAGTVSVLFVGPDDPYSLL
jgi:hypothetical protein